MRTRIVGVLAVVTALLCCALALGCSESEKYNVYEVNYSDLGITEYDIVYSEHNSSYKDDVLTRFVDESHYDKAKWSEDQIEESLETVYPGIDSMSFASKSITDEGDYYCCIVRFDKLDKLDTLKELADNGTLFSSSVGSSSDKLVDASFFETSIKTQGGTQLDESEVEKLGLHFNSSKK